MVNKSVLNKLILLFTIIISNHWSCCFVEWISDLNVNPMDVINYATEGITNFNKNVFGSVTSMFTGSEGTYLLDL